MQDKGESITLACQHKFTHKFMDFQSKSQQILTEEELKARFRSRELFSFAGFLSRKGEEKSYLEKKKTTYFLNIVGFFSGSILRILAGFMAVSGFMAGIFFGSELAGAAAAVVALLALEYLQLRNATELYETWFYKNRIVKGCLFFWHPVQCYHGVLCIPGC